jgi:hypothetical protein
MYLLIGGREEYVPANSAYQHESCEPGSRWNVDWPGGVAMPLGRTSDGLEELRFPRWIERRRSSEDVLKWLTLIRRNN